ncbi:MAG TPA: hypothetical protein VGL81_32210 [Polyangiaceae bacterium]
MSAGGRLDDSGLRGPVATVFVSDPTAEAERVSQALRAAGYVVVDVPLSMLVARVAVQRPRVILIDADSEGALDVVSRMRELPDAEGIDVLFLARPGGAVASPEEAMAHEGSGLFVRPVDIAALVRKVEALTDGAGFSDEPPKGSSIPPPSIPSLPKKRSTIPPSLPPVSMRAPPAAAPMPGPSSGLPPPAHAHSARPSRMPSEPPTSGSASSRRMAGLAPPVSPELAQLLLSAEQRAQTEGDPDSIVPSPEDEIEAVLPAELLAALDEPMEEEDDDDDLVAPARSMRSSTRERTNDGGGSRTTGAGTASTPITGNTPRGTGQRALTGERGLTPPPPHTHAGTQSGGTGAGSSTTGSSEPQSRGDLPAVPGVEAAPPPGEPSRPNFGSIAPPTAWSPVQPMDAGLPPLEDRPSRRAPPSAADSVEDVEAGAAFPSVLGPGDAPRVVARAIALRRGGSMCFATAEAERRIVLREGDVVTLSSTAEDESLLAFLGVRGDLPRETVRRLAPKFPPFGRHAGAALVARGYLRQDQMWPTLRAHAEWLLARLLQLGEARLVMEAQPPGRLAGEPAVFGGSTGAEVFVEVIRRIVPPADAVERLGGLGSRVSEGPEARLLGECALGGTELDQVHAMAGRSLREVLGSAHEGDLATVIFALAQLGVVEVMAAVGERADAADEPGPVAGVAELDAEAIRERVRARMQLVDDGDYFALLGVTHTATGYEVRRAFLELRRAFDPSRVLTPEIVDLADDVRKITVVLEEAYDILKDAARRDRYRRAIEAAPGG